MTLVFGTKNAVFLFRVPPKGRNDESFSQGNILVENPI